MVTNYEYKKTGWCDHRTRTSLCNIGLYKTNQTNVTLYCRLSLNNTSDVRPSADAGQTPTTAIPAGAAVWAGDEADDEVTATGAQTADRGKTRRVLTAVSAVARSDIGLLSFLSLPSRSYPESLCFFFSASAYPSHSCLKKFRSPAGRTAPPVAVLPGAEVTVAAVATVEPSSPLKGNKTTKCGHGASHRSSYCSHPRWQTKAPCPSFISWHDDLWGNESERPCVNKPHHKLIQKQIFWTGNCGLCKAQPYVYIWYKLNHLVNMTHL